MTLQMTLPMHCKCCWKLKPADLIENLHWKLKCLRHRLLTLIATYAIGSWHHLVVLHVVKTSYSRRFSKNVPLLILLSQNSIMQHINKCFGQTILLGVDTPSNPWRLLFPCKTRRVRGKSNWRFFSCTNCCRIGSRSSFVIYGKQIFLVFQTNDTS